MSKHMPRLVAIVVITLAVVGVAFYVMNRQSNTSAYSTNQKTPTKKAPTNTATSPTDNSNAGLNADLQNIDNQMKGLSDDSIKMDQSANP